MDLRGIDNCKDFLAEIITEFESMLTEKEYRVIVIKENINAQKRKTAKLIAEYKLATTTGIETKSEIEEKHRSAEGEIIFYYSYKKDGDEAISKLNDEIEQLKYFIKTYKQHL